MKKCKKIWEVDEAYRSYIKNHYPEAIAFIKNNSNNMFKNKWLDIKRYTNFSKNAPDGSLLEDTKKIILFKTIHFCVFERKIKPNYVKNNIDYNRYLTWKAATDDISNQKKHGVKGERYTVECEFIIKKEPDTIEIIKIDEKTELIDNPNYADYFKTEEYRKYVEEHNEYESAFAAYKNYILNSHDFKLPNGKIKSVKINNSQDKTFDILRELGVSENEIQKSKTALIKPEEPVLPPSPPSQIECVIPAHEEEIVVSGKWAWQHNIKYIKNNKK